ncbi:MAG: GNAT family N-acetyltransferase [Bacillota bacterium]|jgi:ribosomal protein S18 acetylase RimI-like enzyme
MSLIMKELAKEDRDVFIEMSDDFFNSVEGEEIKPPEHFQKNFTYLLSPQHNAKCFLICEQQKRPLGFLVICFSYSTEGAREVIWVEDLYIKSQQRGKQWGSKVLKWLEEQYPQVRLRLETWPSNTGARRLYERMGYQKEKLIPYTKNL